MVAGPPLYALISSGQLDLTTALERWLLVAGGCSVGAWVILQIIEGYEVQRIQNGYRKRAMVSQAMGEIEATQHLAKQNPAVLADDPDGA